MKTIHHGDRSARKATEVPMRILIAEDDPAVQELLTALCLRIDPRLRIDTATRADVAETLLRDGKIYDLVIVDLALADDTHGLDLWFSCHDAYPRLKFLFTSAIAVEEFHAKLKTPTCPVFLQKPFSVLEGTHVLRGMLGL